MSTYYFALRPVFNVISNGKSSDYSTPKNLKLVYKSMTVETINNPSLKIPPELSSLTWNNFLAYYNTKAKRTDVSISNNVSFTAKVSASQKYDNFSVPYLSVKINDLPAIFTKGAETTGQFGTVAYNYGINSGGIIQSFSVVEKPFNITIIAKNECINSGTTTCYQFEATGLNIDVEFFIILQIKCANTSSDDIMCRAILNANETIPDDTDDPNDDPNNNDNISNPSWISQYWWIILVAVLLVIALGVAIGLGVYFLKIRPDRMNKLNASNIVST